MWWSRVSKAFERLMKRVEQIFVLSNASIISLTTFKDAVMVLCCFQKPNSYKERMLLVLRKSFNWLLTNPSRTFDKADKFEIDLCLLSEIQSPPFNRGSTRADFHTFGMTFWMRVRLKMLVKGFAIKSAASFKNMVPDYLDLQVFWSPARGELCEPHPQKKEQNERTDH